jgi:putative ABC transport system permease protein
MFAWLAVPAALFVLLLSGLGMFGVTAFVVSQRMSEMSIRLAMGASGRDVRNLLARESLRPILVGLVIGLAGALLLSRYTGSLFDLSGISSHDPVSVGVALLALGASALTAVLIPAGRAARANPATLFRQQ